MINEKQRTLIHDLMSTNSFLSFS